MRKAKAKIVKSEENQGIEEFNCLSIIEVLIPHKRTKNYFLLV